VGGRVAPGRFAVGGGHKGAARHYGAALIDDGTPTPAHAIFRLKHFVLLCVASLALWGLAMTALGAEFGWDGTLSQMGWFFTKAALLTFGGAYAVLPYVFQGSVEHFHWLTATQMMDGLALGETTPGPLIMVVTFVGFVGGWTRQLFGPEHLLLAGATAATVVTFFTFLPSFVFIFLGAPLIETTHGNLKFTAPLTGITAAVVGVILNLAVFFAYRIFWPQGLGGGIDWFSVLLSAVAAGILFRYKTGIIRLILACGILGLAFTLLAHP
jgi:chromate transporter